MAKPHTPRIPRNPFGHTLSLCHSALASGFNVMWNNGLSMGTGYDYAIMSNVRVGLTYVATYFPGKFITTAPLTDGGVDEFKQEGKSTEPRSMVVRPLWNHAIALSVSVALKNSNAA